MEVSLTKRKKKIAITLAIIVGILSIAGFAVYKVFGAKAAYALFVFHKGNRAEYSLDNVERNKNSKLFGTNIVFLGSSVTEGYGSCGVSFAEYLKAKDGVNPVKEAVSGTTLVTIDESSYIPRMKNINTFFKPDAFVCQLSTNDATKKLPLGTVSESKNPDSFDTSTIAGSIEYIIYYASKTWECPVYFFTGTKYDSPEYEKMVELLYELKNKWNINIIDLWNDEKLNSISKEQRDIYMVDDIHPTKAGYLQWWLPSFERELEKITTKEGLQ